MFKVIICKDYDQLSEEAFKVMKEVVESKEHPVLGLATGSSPVGLYKKMQADHRAGYSYKKCSSYNLDEYVNIPTDHEQSYWTFMHENLFNGLDVDEENIHVPVGRSGDQADCDAYNALLDGVVRDIQVLGIGSNGHIAFNEPGTPFDSRTHIVTLKEGTRQDNARFFNSIDEVPTHAITMGLYDIMCARKILLVANGANKAEAVAQMLEGELSTDFPCTLLKNHPDVTVIIDEPAAAKLTKAY
ncbi:MAG: glucosamine-6-phosphate deaminase [Erysipelotrichaceae bacterium]|nr:glucosamine-6-phosphate deaminase [Erysipelotrichaceae bacterium]